MTFAIPTTARESGESPDPGVYNQSNAASLTRAIPLVKIDVRTETTSRGSFDFSLVLSYSILEKTVMILPQVHLRKPCYDFYFL